MNTDMIQGISLMNPTFVVTQVSGDNTAAVIEVEPLEQGFGHTLGNALRRILLATLPGHAVTRVQIQGADHQFTTLEGMKEDIVEFLLNVKALRISSANTDAGTITLDVKGPRTVTAKDLECPGGVEVTNPELMLATLSASAKLKATLTVEAGVGYSLAAERKNLMLGEIPLDARFSPVTLVSYKVESTRVGRRTDYEKIVFSIQTDGTITPLEVLQMAARILAKQATQVFDPVIVQAVAQPSLASGSENETLRLTVEELDLPTRIANALRKGGFKTVGDLVGVAKPTVSKVKNLGGKSVDLIDEALKKKGVNLAE